MPRHQSRFALALTLSPATLTTASLGGAISPDTRTIHVITDNDETGNLLTQGGVPTSRAANPGALLAFTSTGR